MPEIPSSTDQWAAYCAERGVGMEPFADVAGKIATVPPDQMQAFLAGARTVDDLVEQANKWRSVPAAAPVPPAEPPPEPEREEEA